MNDNRTGIGAVTLSSAGRDEDDYRRRDRDTPFLLRRVLRGCNVCRTATRDLPVLMEFSAHSGVFIIKPCATIGNIIQHVRATTAR